MMHNSTEPITQNRPPAPLRSPRAPLTVVVPTFNRARFLQESLDSLLRQEWRPESILCVDDGSTDETRSVVERYGKDVRYIGKPNGGKSSALNLAIPTVQSEFVWIFDDDDIAYPWAVSTLVPVLQADPSLDFVFGAKDYGVSGPDGRLQFSRAAEVPSALSAGLMTQRVSLFRESIFLLNGTIVRTKAMNAAGAFREDLFRSQDYEFLVRLAAKARFSYIDRSIYMMRRHDEERGPANSRSDAASRQRVWRRFDSAIGAYLRNELDIAVFSDELTELVRTNPELHTVPAERFARITRAWTLATKSQLATMSEDLLAALEGYGTELSGVEKNRLGELMNHHYFVDAMMESIRPLLRLCRLRKSANGRYALRQFARALYWQTRRASGPRHKVIAMTFSALYLFFALQGTSAQSRPEGR